MKNNTEKNTDTKPEKKKLSVFIMIRLAILGFLSGGLLGQVIDIAYPMNGALHYHLPTWQIASIGIEICWWIPLLYGTAGMILVIGFTMFDRLTGQKPRGGYNPSWKFTFASIGVFIIQWWMGPFLFNMGVSNIWLLVFTVPTGILVWWIFDNTKGGLFMCLLTAILGPMIEITLINVFSLYSYTIPDIFGIPLWILGAYICGSPANGNLGRKYIAFLTR